MRLLGVSVLRDESCPPQRERERERGEERHMRLLLAFPCLLPIFPFLTLEIRVSVRSDVPLLGHPPPGDLAREEAEAVKAEEAKAEEKKLCKARRQPVRLVDRILTPGGGSFKELQRYIYIYNCLRCSLDSVPKCLKPGS